MGPECSPGVGWSGAKAGREFSIGRETEPVLGGPPGCVRNPLAAVRGRLVVGPGGVLRDINPRPKYHQVISLSITLVVLSGSANQFVPSFIRNFVRNRQIHASIGLFFSTIVLILVVCSMSSESVPVIAVNAASALAGLSLFAMLFHVHKVARSIIADTKVVHVAGELNPSIDAGAALRTLVFVSAVIGSLSLGAAFAQEGGGGPAPAVSPNAGEAPAAPRQPVSVVPPASDQEIANRLTRILSSSSWFENPRVEVRDGVVFLDGVTSLQDHRSWAGELAGNTEGSVAVVNRIEVEADVRSTFGRAGEELARLARQAAQTWPLVLLAFLIVAAAWIVSRLVGRIARLFLSSRISSPLLLAVVVRLFSIPVFLLGVYFVLQVAGLTRLAITVLGGTGLIGIVIGFAFRDIAENFLASLLLSVRNPFKSGDLIEVAGHTGIVQNLNTRSTVLLTLDGNHVQIPNAMVFKSTITNFSSTPSRRAEFVIGIGYDSPTAKAQALINEVLRKHTAVLNEPEPLVLVQSLGAATVDLKVRYWFDSATYAPDKINSALLRLCKNVLLQGGIELPDPAREVVFPKGVPILQAEGGKADEPSAARQPVVVPEEDASEMTAGEGGLSQERLIVPAGSEVPEATENLLKR